MISPRSKARAAGNLGWLALVLALAAGAATRFWNLSAASLHTDEAFTFAVSALPMPALLHNVAVADFHPPLFYMMTHNVLQWSWPQSDYRYLTAAFGLVTIVATWGAARRMFGGTTAGVAALAVALQPALVQHDRLYRMYALTVALCTLSWWLLVEAQQAFGRKQFWLWLGYGVIAVILPYVDYLGAFMLACQGLYALTRRPALTPALGALALTALAYIPWVSHLAQQMPLGGMALGRPALDAGLAASIRGAVAAGMPAGWLAWPGAALAPALGLTALMLVAGWLGRRSALPFWLGAIVLQVGCSIALGKNLAYFPRYLLIDVPPICIAFGLVVATLLATRARLVAVGVGLAGLSSYAVGVSNILFDPYYQFPNWYAVNALMLPNEQPTDAIVMDAGYEFLVIRNYTAFRGRTTLIFMNPNDFAPVHAWIKRHPDRRIWYIQHQNFYWDPSRRIEAELAQHRKRRLTHRWERQSPVDDVSLVLFDKVPMTKRR